ncbi:DUF3080 domain-containing protein [Vibrio sp. TBV020]|uniref:DUF3080 domain-containing protein n=1 Tax=Vibrio sp. TBV020 TaxID=3137398 RepID=UPI0038CD9FBC
MRILRATFGLISLTFILIGCKSESPSRFFETYSERVANVLDTPDITQDVSITQLPRKRELYLTIPPITLGLLDSYQLRQCGLFQLIAERNSVLGKVADEFSNYDYQSALLKGLTACIDDPNVDSELKPTLRNIRKEKREQLGMHQWNLLYASDAMQAQLKGASFLTVGMSEQVQQVSNALTELNQAFYSESEKSNVIEAQETLEKTAVLGNLYYSLSHATAQLSLITEQLNMNDHKVICAPQRDITRFKYLNNVFDQQYIGKVQPYLATLDSYYQQLSPNLTLFKPQPELHPFIYPLEQSHSRFRQATLEHIQYWQQLFKRCGRKVG